MSGHVILRTAFNNVTTGTKHRVEGADLQDDVASLKAKAAELVGVNPAEIEMVYCGRIMRDGLALSTYGIKSGATIMVSKRAPVPSESAHVLTFDAAALQKVSSAIRIRSHRHFQQALEKTLDNATAFDDILRHNTPLSVDPIAIALLQDADLLMLTLGDSTSRLRVFEAHPGLGEAVIELMGLVNNEIEKTSSGASSSASRRQYNLDRMDSEDEEEEDMEVNSNLPTDFQHPAVAAPGPGGLITTDFFRQAMLASTGLGAPPASATATAAAAAAAGRPVVTEEQLQQLRDMGIYDEALARRALEASNGDIQAALEFIFGDDS